MKSYGLKMIIRLQYCRRSSSVIFIILYILQQTAATNVFNSFVPIYLSDNSKSNSSSHSLYVNTSAISVDLSNAYNNQSSSLIFKKSKVPSQSNDASLHNILDLTGNLEKRLKSIRNNELAIPLIQEMFDTMEFSSIYRNDTKTATDIANKISHKLNKAIRILNQTKEFIDTNTDGLDEKIILHTMVHPCPYDEQSLQYDKSQIEIKNYLKNVGNFADQDDLNFTINNEVLEKLRQYSGNVDNFKQIYFISKNDYVSEYNCHFHSANVHLR